MARKFTDALDHELTDPSNIDLPSTGGIDGVRESSIQPVTDLGTFEDKAAKLAFGEETMTVIISEDSNPLNPEPYVYLANSGRGAMPNGVPWVPRGVPVDIKRKFVEQLCRAKPIAIKTVEVTQADGARGIQIQRNASLKYPFTVVRDDNPKGAAWLREMLRSAA